MRAHMAKLLVERPTIRRIGDEAGHKRCVALGRRVGRQRLSQR